MCLFIAQQAQVDIKAHGGRNPLIEQALELSIFPPEDDELDELRGERTGYVTDQEGRRMMREAATEQRPGRVKPTGEDTVEVDGEGNFVGYALGAQEVTEAAPGGAQGNGPGSFEAFMATFAGGVIPGPPPAGRA